MPEAAFALIHHALGVKLALQLSETGTAQDEAAALLDALADVDHHLTTCNRKAPHECPALAPD